MTPADYFLAGGAAVFGFGRMAFNSSCGRGITSTLITVPSFEAAAAPADRRFHDTVKDPPPLGIAASLASRDGDSTKNTKYDHPIRLAPGRYRVVIGRGPEWSRFEQVVDLTKNSVVVEFNDIPALERALSKKDIACVITEPVLTNSCMVLPDPGFHRALRQLTSDTGTLLLIDETHTISSGLGGYTRVNGLEPDIFVLGKPVAGGVPASIWGLSQAVAARFMETEKSRPAGHSGMGTTLSANPVQFAAMRACLSDVMTKGNYAHMDALADQLESGLRKIIKKRKLPWHVARVGARVEFICAPGPLHNGTESEAAHQPELEKCIHLALLNRGTLIAPFHNMMLISPATKRKQVNRLISNFAEITKILTH